jgi:hypothetical protein
MTTQADLQTKVHWRTLFAFIVPSLIGVFLFMTPVAIGEAMTIPIAVLAKKTSSTCCAIHSWNDSDCGMYYSDTEFGGDIV